MDAPAPQRVGEPELAADLVPVEGMAEVGLGAFDLSSVRFWISAAERMPTDLIREFRRMKGRSSNLSATKLRYRSFSGWPE